VRGHRVGEYFVFLSKLYRRGTAEAPPAGAESRVFTYGDTFVRVSVTPPVPLGEVGPLHAAAEDIAATQGVQSHSLPFSIRSHLRCFASRA
jgi:hypothetical protein